MSDILMLMDPEKSHKEIMSYCMSLTYSKATEMIALLASMSPSSNKDYIIHCLRVVSDPRYIWGC